MKIAVEKHQSDKYQKIIQAATHVFASKGFYNAKVSDVAREAEVADGTIYLYFKNKDDILISIFEESIDRFIKAAHDKLEGVNDPVAKLQYFIELHLELVEENQDVAQVLQIELRQSTKFMKEYAAQKFMDYLAIISEAIEEGQKQGLFKKGIQASIVKRAIFGAVDEMALEWVLMKKKKYSLKQVAEQISLMLVEGLRS
ncbi:MAG: TetR/AcrR family transcriptional regulator [Deltaproteobacteria bacterium]|nr:TetR/AcrR family transcriptional regulator [Deltaproteobacteria bacterium]